MASYLLMIIGNILVHNFVLNRFLGCCPFLGVSKKLDTALGMSGAVIFVITAASAVTWCVNKYILVPNDLEYLQTIAFILVIAAFVQFIDLLMKKFLPALHGALGIFLPLITTNCAVLGVAVMNTKGEFADSLLKSVVFGFSAATGFALALIIFTGIREKLEHANPPHAFKGVALSLVTAGLLSLAFMGFNGLVK
ncbi:MAG: electron transport complex subunit RsxA [Kiritimatiellia bacterium]|jgi:electron transport complex protein RnfA